jgi:hypothetical protein
MAPATVMGVWGEGALHQERPNKVFTWLVERGARRNYRRLGKHLAARKRSLYRNGSERRGLILVSANGSYCLITKASQLVPVIVDSMNMRVMREGKVVSELPTTFHLNAMLIAEAFLEQFRPLDHVSKTPLYLADFTILQPGYHDGGEGRRLLYVGPAPRIADSTTTIQQLLDVICFATNADRTNTVAAALTVRLRHHWPGQKPVVAVTANKSHAGKGTVTDFICGDVAKADVLYESNDWPMQSQLQRQIIQKPDIGVICFDNVRLDSAGGRSRSIRSAFVESFVTNPEITLASPGAGEPVRLMNSYVVAINTNDGSLSPDLLNRALSIHLILKGDVHDRRSPIGNPKLEFLPQNHAKIDAELGGMIEVWVSAGCPLDDVVSHPMTPWARTIGGILKVNGFCDFLGNSTTRRVADNPVREALGILAAAKPNKELRPSEWAQVAVEQGLSKTLFQNHERDTEPGRERAIGVILSKHLEETLEATTETTQLRVRLEGGHRRWVRGENPHSRYVFRVVEEKARAEDK